MPVSRARHRAPVRELVGLHVIRLARHLVRLAPGPLALVGLLVLLVARRILAHDADADRVLAITHAVRVLPGRRLHVVRLARRDRLGLVVHLLLVHLGHHFRRGLIVHGAIGATLFAHSLVAVRASLLRRPPGRPA